MCVNGAWSQAEQQDVCVCVFVCVFVKRSGLILGSVPSCSLVAHSIVWDVDPYEIRTFSVSGSFSS